MKSPIAIWRDNKKKYRKLGKKGTILSFTKIINPPKGFGNIPYYVVVVGFKNSLRSTGQLITEGQEPKIGAKVIGVVRRIGDPGEKAIINYGIKYKITKE